MPWSAFYPQNASDTGCTAFAHINQLSSTTWVRCSLTNSDAICRKLGVQPHMPPTAVTKSPWPPTAYTFRSHDPHLLFGDLLAQLTELEAYSFLHLQFIMKGTARRTCAGQMWEAGASLLCGGATLPAPPRAHQALG